MKKLGLLMLTLALCSCETHFREKFELEFHGIGDQEKQAQLDKKETKKLVNHYHLNTPKNIDE